ncbi:MAG: class I SAM-dependent methyltransferase [Bacteroidetes bacterium]|nr:class I SAM-dependent methyltransferase [Bacteroidota bacterium]
MNYHHHSQDCFNPLNLEFKQHPAWFKSWFDSPFYHQLYGYRNEAEAATFLDILLIKLQPRLGSRMMDLGCGTGRHAKYLAAKGFEVIGADLSSLSIQRAKQFETHRLRFYQHDMRLPFGCQYYDFVFNFFTSFGYFKNDDENHQVIKNIHSALKPGGIAIIDYLNVGYSAAYLIPEEEREIDFTYYHITRWADEKHFFKQIAIDDQKTKANFHFCERVEKLYLHDFEHLFSENGLSLLEVYGDYSLAKYRTLSSPRMIMVARKP